MTFLQTAPGHDIYVTGGGPFGRAWFDCSCGIERRFASKRAAAIAALIHHHETSGCNCPDDVVNSDVHASLTTQPRTHEPREERSA